MASTETFVGLGGGLLKIAGRVTRAEATERAREMAQKDLERAQKVLAMIERPEGLSIHCWRGNERRPLLGEDSVRECPTCGHEPEDAAQVSS